MIVCDRKANAVVAQHRIEHLANGYQRPIGRAARQFDDPPNAVAAAEHDHEYPLSPGAPQPRHDEPREVVRGRDTRDARLGAVEPARELESCRELGGTSRTNSSPACQLLRQSAAQLSKPAELGNQRSGDIKCVSAGRAAPKNQRYELAISECLGS